MDLQKTALVLIDFQKESKYGIEGVDEAVQNAHMLIDHCRSNGIPVIYTRQINRADAVGLPNKEVINDDGKPAFYCSGTDTAEVIDEIKEQSQDFVVDKQRWTAFYQTNLDLILKSLNVKHVIIGGFVTDACLMTTVFDAYARDYQVNLVKDICAATNSGSHMAAILIMANWVYDIKIYDAKQLINKLDGQAHHVWEPSGPDQMQFTPENIREVFSRLSKSE